MNRFEDLYKQSPDPWQVRTTWYEQRKRSLLACVLPKCHYGRAMELGCGNGEFTRVIARRCDMLIAVDVSPTAMSLCEETIRNDGLTNVRTGTARLPAQWPLGDGATVDLIVVSELAYYFSEPDLAWFLDRCRASLAPEGELVMCGYTKGQDDKVTTTPGIHARVDRLDGFARIISHQDERFQLDVWRKQ